MSFRYKNFTRIGQQVSTSPNCYAYETADTISNVNSAGYFASGELELKVNDIIFVSASDGRAVLSVTAASPVAAVDFYGSVTGFANYMDTQYTIGSPLSLVANTDTILPNNAGSVYELQKPADVDTFYDGSVITGRNGDGISITVDAIALPTSAGTTLLEVWFDITGGTGEPASLANIYRRLISFPKGNGVARPFSFTVTGYTLDTWEGNGAEVYVRANGTLDLYDIRYIVTRTHKAA